MDRSRWLTILASMLTLLMGFSTAGLGQSVAWIGGATGNWNTPANWSGGIVPNNGGSAAYLATIAQSLAQYTQVTVDLPTLELTQLNIRNVSTVIVPATTTLRLRDTGAGVNLIRSFAGGGVLRLDGGRLELATAGSVLSGAAAISMNNARIAGSGRFEPGRPVTGSGLIGAASNSNDSALWIALYSNSNIPAAQQARLEANNPSVPLIISPTANSFGYSIVNSGCTIGATKGATLIVRGNGGIIGNTTGFFTADANAQVQFGSGVELEGGTLNGAGSFKIPAGESATLRDVSATGQMTVDGSLRLDSVNHSGTLNVNNAVTGSTLNQSGTVNLVASATVPIPLLNFAGSAIQNTGTIAGGGEIRATTITSTGTIQANVNARTLTIAPTVSINLGTSGKLSASNGRLQIGTTGDSTSTLTGTCSVGLENGFQSAMTLNLTANLPNAVIVNDGVLTINRPLTVASVASSARNGSINANAALTANAILGKLWARAPVTLRIGGGVSRGAVLSVEAGGSIDLANNSYIVDYTDVFDDSYDALRQQIASRSIFCSPGLSVGIVKASAISAPSVWLGNDIDSTTILLRPTLRGDTNLDSFVNFDDMLRLAQNYGTVAGGQWVQGDTNYDNAVNFSDLLVLVQNYGGSLAVAERGLSGMPNSDFMTDFALATTLVPEPATLGVTAILAGIAIGCRFRVQALARK